MEFGNKRISPKKAILFLTVVIPLLNCILLTPITQIIRANMQYTASVVLTILSFFSDTLLLCAIFALLGMIVYGIYAQNGSIVTLSVSSQYLSLVFIGVLLQAGVYLLLAFLDEIFSSLPFYLSYYTLSNLTSGTLIQMLISPFFGMLLLFLIIGLSVAVTVWMRNRAVAQRIPLSTKVLASFNEKENPMRKAVIGITAVYFVINLGNYIYDLLHRILIDQTIQSIGDMSEPIANFVLLLIYTVLCYYIVFFCSVCAAKYTDTQKSFRN